MYEGTMIEELMAAVERAEQHARMLKLAERKPEPAMVLPPMYQQFVYEAPFGASMIGAA